MTLLRGFLCLPWPWATYIKQHWMAVCPKVWAQGTGVKVISRSQERATCWIAFHVFACSPWLAGQEVQPQCEATQKEQCTGGKQSIIKVQLVDVSWPAVWGLWLLPGPLCEVGIRIFPVSVGAKGGIQHCISMWAEKWFICQYTLSLGFMNFAILIKSVCWGISSCENVACLHFNRYINIYPLLNFSHAPQTFSKEVDEKSSLKSSVVSTGSQLLQLKQADIVALRSSLVKFEQEWGELITQLPTIQEKLHQVSEKLLPSLSSS